MGEEKDIPARVTLLELPSRNENRVKNLLSVADCKMYWQKSGDGIFTFPPSKIHFYCLAVIQVPREVSCDFFYCKNCCYSKIRVWGVNLDEIHAQVIKLGPGLVWVLFRFTASAGYIPPVIRLRKFPQIVVVFI